MLSDKCGICGTDTTKLATDNCPETGKVRGLLCHKCHIILSYYEHIQKNKLLPGIMEYLNGPH